MKCKGHKTDDYCKYICKKDNCVNYKRLKNDMPYTDEERLQDLSKEQRV